MTGENIESPSQAAPIAKKKGRPQGSSRAQLLAKNQALEERLVRLEAAFSARPTGLTEQDAARLAAAIADLATLRPQAAQDLGKPPGPRPALVRYRGAVQATEDCAYDGYHFGPNSDKGRPEGDVFEVDVPTLWSDDPYVPVALSGTRDDGSPRYVRRTDVPIVDFRWRERGNIAAIMAKAV